MPPITKISKSDIVNSAVEIVRKSGIDALNARSLAAELSCSTQPIFSNFSGMEELRVAIIDRGKKIFSDFVESAMTEDKYPPYKASGMAYIEFAKVEKNLFSLLFMRDRFGEDEEHFEIGDKITARVKIDNGFDEDTAKLFHLEMWAFVHGIASMIATGYLELDTELVSRMLTDSYQGLKLKYGEAQNDRG
ncbi:MAG: TetR/AcrR family transcriptional regulator [Ruminococcaceae bacterium]|nr:TetR/AcrR family transcriptional regulator [Oscillospiraceae bacterium]